MLPDRWKIRQALEECTKAKDGEKVEANSNGNQLDGGIHTLSEDDGLNSDIPLIPRGNGLDTVP